MYIYKLYILTLYFYICRYEMTELRKRKDNDVGFIDPNVVFKHPNPPPEWKAELKKNLMRFLVNQQNKDILFPYNFK